MEEQNSLNQSPNENITIQEKTIQISENTDIPSENESDNSFFDYSSEDDSDSDSLQNSFQEEKLAETNLAETTEEIPPLIEDSSQEKSNFANDVSKLEINQSHSVYILGKPGSGKNYLLTELLPSDFFLKYVFLVVVGPNFNSRANEFFRNWCYSQKYIKKKNFVHFRGFSDIFFKFANQLHYAVIIIDDTIIVNNRHGREFAKLLINVRHKNLFIAILSQNIKYLTPDLREFIDIFIHFNINTAENTKKAYNLFFSGQMLLEDFKKINLSLKQYDIHFINNRTGERGVIIRRKFIKKLPYFHVIEVYNTRSYYKTYWKRKIEAKDYILVNYRIDKGHSYLISSELLKKIDKKNIPEYVKDFKPIKFQKYKDGGYIKIWEIPS